MSRAPEHHWYFEGETFLALRERLNALGAGVLRVWKEGDALFLDVEESGEIGEALRPIGIRPLNDSHVCPGSPGCPHG